MDSWHKPPLVCIEILSPDDTLHRLRERVDDYLAMGVENVWVLDPSDRRAYVVGLRGFVEPDQLHLAAPGTDILLDLQTVFALMDEI
jgi:Uma2 family endonuclease